MIVERTNNELIIRLPATVDAAEIQDLLSYLRYQELTSKFTVKQSKVDKLARQVNQGWWERNKDKFIK
ncbi:hypothetical protein AHMF7605_09210 [Adhaeribacter arboris]|uniref:Uncharacterized protein n=1 Tax=Adhaeribacter arboris TaxID=2072846 RepID=A0A2T2YDW1_9BACT|nr:hypothetical protein [Adhaeribacter arboris]PSR53691.1 hypothetical protein AHMF7605_09210 [Adhaeribacter arboris]